VTDDQDALREALKRTAVALKEGDVGFALGGGYAGWALGGPEPEHDVDFLVAHSDTEQAVRVLTGTGLRVEQPPEDWLIKVFTEDGSMVDLIFRINDVPVDSELLARARTVDVLSVYMPVLAATDLLASKMLALSEHSCDLGTVLPAARALREQVDWERLRELAAPSPFAQAFVFLAERLEITGG
jgi:predicted nucleotidyltransferase